MHLKSTLSALRHMDQVQVSSFQSQAHRFHPCTPFTATFFNRSAAYQGSSVNLSAHPSALKVMYGGVLPVLNKVPFAIIKNITVIQYMKPLER